MSRFHNHSRVLCRMLVGVAMISLTCFVWTAANLYRQRKAMETGGAAPCAAPDQAADTGTEPADGMEQDAYIFSRDVVEYKGGKYRRNSYVKAILCIGVDRAGDMKETTTSGFGGQADGLFLIAQDTARGAIKILMIPRDTMTDITLTDLRGNVLGKDMQHLNLAYAYGDGREKSCEYMTEAVSELLGGLKIEWYLAADTSAVPVLNDEAGGVTVTIETDGMETRDPALVKGRTVRLQGKQAEIYVRFRDVNTDHSALYRMDQQQRYIQGFFQAVKQNSARDSGLVMRLFDKAQDYMVTNMAKDRYLKIAMDAVAGGTLDDEDFYTLPGEGVVSPRYDEFYADREALIPVILELFYREIP